MYLKIVLLLGMLFCHIVDDYYLQGWLASAKQKSWWQKNAPEKLYKNDYLMALCEHAFSWTCMIMAIPTIYTYLRSDECFYIISLVFFSLNWTIHCIVDNYKANLKRINLIQDQLIHIGQIIWTWLILVVLVR